MSMHSCTSKHCVYDAQPYAYAAEQHASLPCLMISLAPTGSEDDCSSTLLMRWSKDCRAGASKLCGYA